MIERIRRLAPRRWQQTQQRVIICIRCDTRPADVINTGNSCYCVPCTHAYLGWKLKYVSGPSCTGCSKQIGGWAFCNDFCSYCESCYQHIVTGRISMREDA